MTPLVVRLSKGEPLVVPFSFAQDKLSAHHERLSIARFSASKY